MISHVTMKDLCYYRYDILGLTIMRHGHNIRYMRELGENIWILYDGLKKGSSINVQRSTLMVPGICISLEQYKYKFSNM